MPANLVVINGSAGLTWEVENSKIDELMEFLHKVGVQQQPSLPEAKKGGEGWQNYKKRM